MPSPYVQDLFETLAADDRLDLKVWYLEQEAHDTYWGEQEMPPYAKVLPGRWYWLLGARVHYNHTIRKELAADDADLVVVVGYVGLTNQIAMRWLNRRKRKWVFWGEIPGFKKRGSIGGWVRRRLQSPLKQAAGIAAVGSHAVEAYRKVVASEIVASEIVASGERRETSKETGNSPPLTPNSQLATRNSPLFANIPYHCRVSEFAKAAASRVPSDQVRFLYCGQLIERKGVDLMCAAFARLIRDGHRATLTLAGEGPLRQTLLDSLDDSVKPHVNFLGFQEVGVLPAVFAESDVFLLPSRHDGWGVVVNQAVAAGMPVIATEAVGAANDLVDSGKNGFRIAPDKESSIYDAMLHFVNKPQDVVEFGKKSSQVAKRISLAQAADDWVEFFELAIGKRETSSEKRGNV